MWMEEKLGSRINGNRTAEAIATGAETIAIGCPFCNIMLGDGVAEAQSDVEREDQVQVMDVARLLLRSVKQGQPTS